MLDAYCHFMKGKHLVVILAALLLLVSCGTQIPTQAKLSEAKLGPKPSRDVAVEIATACLRSRFPQDDLSRIAFGKIEPGYYAQARGSFAQRFAWMLLTSVDVKNDCGLYEGAKPYHFYFLGDQLVATAFPEEAWNGREYRRSYRISQLNGGGIPAFQAGLTRWSHKAGDN